MKDEDIGITFKVVPGPNVVRDLSRDNDGRIRLSLIDRTRCDQKTSTGREEDAMSHTERGEDAACPSQSVTDWHSLRDVLEDKHHDDSIARTRAR